MFRNNKVVGLIPARGASKRLPKKNLRLLAGKPLISWTVEAARKSYYIDMVVVSTEDQRIADQSMRDKVDVVIERPNELAADDTDTVDVIFHALEALDNQGHQFGHLVLLQPTSPLRTNEHINQAFKLVEQVGAVGAVSVCRTEHPIEWMGKLYDSKFMDQFFAETNLKARSRDLVPSYQVNGAIYIAQINRFVLEKTLYIPTRTAAYVMDRRYSIDIDYDSDLELAEYFLTNNAYDK